MSQNQGIAKNCIFFLISTLSSPVIAFLDLISCTLKTYYSKAVSASPNQNK